MSASNQQPSLPPPLPPPPPAAPVVVKEVKDPVKRDGVIKEQVCAEKEAQIQWDKKWHFMSDYYKLYLEEAAKEGLSEEEFLKLRITKNGRKTQEVDSWRPKESGPFPVTSTGMVGWRSSRLECSLERFGPLYTSPRHTLDLPGRPPSPPQKHIILG